MRLLIVFAHPEEAKPALDYLKANVTEPNLFSCKHAQILISGLGALAAATQTAIHGRSVDEIWNLGICGALQPNLSPGDLLEIGCVGRHLFFPPGTAQSSQQLSLSAHPEIFIGNSVWKLISCDVGVQTQELRDTLSSNYHLVDMEGYGIARAAHTLNKPCRMWKIVSDLANSQTPQSIKERLPALAVSLAEHLIHVLTTPTSA